MEEAVKKKWLPWVLWGLAALLAFWLGIRVGRAYYDRKVPNFTGVYEFYVRPGMEPSAVVDTLLKSGVVRKPGSLRRVLGPLKSMQVGH